MKTWHLHLNGRVQGVGFRPYVFNFAIRRKLKGSVLNGQDGVHVHFNAPDLTAAKNIQSELLRKLPTMAEVSYSNLSECELQPFLTFEILSSQHSGPANLTLTPDLAMCKACEQDILNQENRRAAYAFTTCTDCGPRYSIMHTLPYDRENTEMDIFHICPACQMEYDTPSDKRFYSQTQSCSACGIQMSLKNLSAEEPAITDQDLIIPIAANELKKGEIIGVLGIGGYLLCCDAQNREAIRNLRNKKRRPWKPLAVMYPDIQEVKKEFQLSSQAEQLLTSEISPVTLLKPLENCSICLEELAPGLNQVGVMIPYAPLFKLLLEAFNSPIVATSGNTSGSPINYRVKEAEQNLSGIADFLLSHNRNLNIPQDDSVIIPASEKLSTLILRRSRGMAPSAPSPGLEVPDGVLAMGADLKSSFSISHRGNIYTSQYLGDMGSYDTELHYEKTLEHLSTLLGFTPKTILIDKHPGYFSGKKGKEIGRQSACPVFEIQHHEAHFAAIIGENKLIETEEPVLGIIWDGVGYGNDKQIWGGEFFLYQQKHFVHTNQFPPFRHILNDKFSKSPQLPALSLTNCYNLSLEMAGITQDYHQNFFNKILNAEPALYTSSMGRVFDGVSYILGFRRDNTYEGEAAVFLQASAERFLDKNPTPKRLIKPHQSFKCFLHDLLELAINPGLHAQLAWEFHLWTVEFIDRIASDQKVKTLAFSGGVFQNHLLYKLISSTLSDKYKLYFHEKLPANDESISYGQIIHHTISRLLLKLENKPQ